ncbi:MAG: 4-hydroxy-tetrahydrodipicolinate reductase [Pseudomonadota bacterium]
MIKVIVTGSKGRMGSQIVNMIKESKDLSLAAEVDIGGSLNEAISSADVVIDFTVPEASLRHAEMAARHAKAIVIGTTGFSAAQEATLRAAARTVPVVCSPNMSAGVNVMWKLVETAAHALGRQFKVDIVETHHVHKLDKPSGTAKRILDIVLKKSGRRLDKDVFFYEEETLPRKGEDMEVSVRSVRRGEIVGDHVIHFTSPGETISIQHHAGNRSIFAEGALVATRWVVGKPAGLYDMGDVLGL